MILRLLQQIASSSLILLFGVLALQVWRRFGTVRRERAALSWAVTAASFLVVGVYATTHAVISAASVAAGKESWLFGFVSRAAHGVNVARALVPVCFGLLLLALMIGSRRNAPRIASAAPAVLVATAVGSTLGAGWLPDMTPHAFFTMLAVMNAATAVVLMAALLAAVQNDGMDQLLWLALAAYALKETVSVSLMGVISFWGLADVHIYLTGFWYLQVGVGIGMAALAVRRLQLAGGGRRVPAVFERMHALRRHAHGPTGPV